MRYRLLVTALLVLALAPADAGAATTRTCAVKGSDTVASNRFARVFTVEGRGDVSARLYGCLHSANRRVALDFAADDLVTSQSFSAPVLNGRFVAWQHDDTDISCKADCPPGYDPTTERLTIVDLRSKRRRTIDAAVVGGAIAVSRTGSLAWVGQGDGALVVYAARSGGRTYEPLDAGDIDARSLRLRGTVLSWRNAGVAKSATLR